MLNILDSSYSIFIRKESGAPSPVYQHCLKNSNDLHQSVEVVLADVNSQLASSHAQAPITFIAPLQRVPDTEDFFLQIPALSATPLRCVNVGDFYSLDAAGFASALPGCATAAAPTIPRFLLTTLKFQPRPVEATIEATPTKPPGMDHAFAQNHTPMQRTTTRFNLLQFTPQKFLQQQQLTATGQAASRDGEDSSDLLSLDDEDTDSMIDDEELEFQQQAAIRALQEGRNWCTRQHMDETAAGARAGGFSGDNFGGIAALAGSGAGTTVAATGAAAGVPPCDRNHSNQPSTPGPSALPDSHPGNSRPSSQQLLLSRQPSEADFLRAWESLKEEQQRQAPPQLGTPTSPQKKRKLSALAASTAESEVDVFCGLFAKPASREQQLETELVRAQFELQKQRLAHYAAVSDMRSSYEARIRLLEVQAQVAEDRAQLQEDVHEAAMAAMQEELCQAQAALMRQQQAASRQMQWASNVAKAAQDFLAAMVPQDCLQPEASVAVDNC